MIENIDFNKIVVSNKFPFGKQNFKYFIGYKDNKEIRPFCILFQKWVHITDILTGLNECVLW